MITAAPTMRRYIAIAKTDRWRRRLPGSLPQGYGRATKRLGNTVMRRFGLALLLGFWALVGPPGNAHEFKFGDVGVATPWARATIGAGKIGVAFLTIHNRGAALERLVGASTPIAKRTALHTHDIDKGVMKMRPIEKIDVAPGGAVTLAPGGLHIMLIRLKYALREGSSFPLTLTFEGAGSATITVDVRSAIASSGHAHDNATANDP